MTTKIAIFDHKSGVFQTMTSYYLSRAIASLDKKVLLVDADPQCLLSSWILGDRFKSYYFDNKTKLQNIKDGVKVAFERRTGKLIEKISCFSPPDNNNLFLLAGHPELSEYESSLSFAHYSNNTYRSLENLPGAFNELIMKTTNEYAIDFVLINLAPGLSSINQNLFISSDMFILPIIPDEFSIMAIETLSGTLPRWVDWANRMRSYADTDIVYPLADSLPKFIGYIIQHTDSNLPDNIDTIKDDIKDKFISSCAKQNMLLSKDDYINAGIADDYCLFQIGDNDFRSFKENSFFIYLHNSDLGNIPSIKKPDENQNNKNESDELIDNFKKLAEKLINLESHEKSIPTV